ncbi:MAG: 5-methyltetrahydropteroyltriglutamate--homocysteine S-methyltransferase, partial [Nitrospinae bacterium]|nr:5-methyltetrahydropteroyltriglutamate--homocysteine S-methyltransferase [Nitrospinota bacterium]
MGGHSQRLPQKVQAANLGFPRIGPNRELKFATEKYWQHELDQAALEHTAQTLRAANWRLQRDLRVGVIPSNDFSLYDHVLDMTALLGAVPARFGWRGGAVDLDTYFAMARGRPEAPAMEMTKWFDTNYHYIVPEFTPEQRFVLATDKPVREFREAQALGIHTRPVLLGPVTYLLLGKAKGAQFDPLRLLDRLLPVYEALLAELAQAGADWVQMDEPYLALELSEAARAAYGTAYRRLGRATQIMLTTYFAAVDESWATVASLPVAGLHIDLVRAPAQLEAVLAALGDEQVLSLGLIDGRNVWRADLDYALALVQQAQARVGRARLQVAPSCSLLHCPLDLDREQQLAPDLKRWLAFAVQKLQEVTLLALAANGAPDLAAWSAARHALASRDSSPRVHNAAVHQRVAALTPAMRQRAPTHERRQAQAQALALPLFPTTTIGSFPQTAELRRVRAAWRRGTLTTSAYEQLLRTQIADVIHWQEAIGLDVLVHGEFERNDMVEYFAERLEGFAFTTHGWVQSYGSRYVKPPIIFGDVWRPQPMTVSWLAYAQSLTPRPVKGMLTGPVTMLHWSFVRDDQPLADTACQIALALRDEVQ